MEKIADSPPKVNMLASVRKLFRMLKPEKKDIGLLYIYAILSGIISLSLPLGIQAIITYLMGSYISTSLILLIALVIGGTAFVSLLQIFQLSIVESLQQKIFLRSSLEYSYRIPLLEVKRNAGSRFDELANRFFDTLTLQKDVPKLLMDLSSAGLQMIFGLILISFYHPVFAFFSLLLLGFLFLVFRFSAPKGLGSSLQESSMKFEIADAIQKSGRAHWWYKAPAPFRMLLSKADEMIGKYLLARKAHFRVLLAQYRLLLAFKVTLIGLLLIVGGNLVVSGQINLGQFIASEIVIILIMGSVEKLILSMESIYDVLTAIEKVALVPESDLERSTGIEPKEPLHTMTFQNAELVYGQHAIFSKLNLNLKIEEKIAWVITDASERQLFARFLQGHLTVNRGNFKLNAIEHSQIGLRWWRREIQKIERTEAGFGDSFFDRIGLEKDEVDYERLNEVLEVLTISQELAKWNCSIHDVPESEWVFNQEIFLWRFGMVRSLFCNPRLLLLDTGEIPAGIDVGKWVDLAKNHSTSGIWLLVPEASEAPADFRTISIEPQALDHA